LCVTLPQAATMLNCTVRAVRELLWAKKLPHAKIGKRFVVSIEELRAFVRRSAA
jgi:excisionase family DNA binding protein